MPTFPSHRQRNQMDCGPTCLYLVAWHYGRSFSMEKLRELTEIGKEGVNLLGISDAAEKIGFRTLAVQPTLQELKQDVQKPCILHWEQNHFVVLYKVKRQTYFISDPAKGLVKYTEQEFARYWISSSTEDGKTGIALNIEPTPDFYDKEYDENYADNQKKDFSSVVKYLYPYKKLLFQLVLGLLVGSLLSLIFPFLTQSIVDTGINTGNIEFIYIILIAQLSLFAGRLTVDFIRSWILYHISSRINISILTDFLIKLMRLPVSYFDSKKTGDIMQRMNDHKRIQSFLTGTSLSTLFSMFNLVVFSVVLAMYNSGIFFVFLLAAVLYVAWIILFLKKRKKLDYKQFDVAAAEQGKTMEIVQGMQEIKLHGCEQQKRWQWERLQAKTFKLGIKNLALSQWQQTGAFLINEGKNIVITFLAAKAVIDGDLTLGGMVAIQYIIGQLNSPIEQMVGFVQSWQLAKISLDRLNEINTLKEEEPANVMLAKVLPSDKTLSLESVAFTYPGAGNEPVLQNIDLIIPHGKTTAIVGTSGSGKTTLLKMLLRFYSPQKGTIHLGGNNLENISPRTLRRNVGVVMQESFIFSDSIGANIAVDEDSIDLERLRHAANVANVLSFIEGLPLGFNTKIGAEGTGVSAGQKQRILIARAVYKNPPYIFFDEATNSLDANNETQIMKNLDEFFQDKTVLVVAHRLSTVKNADNIIVLNNGGITEQGTHQELTNMRGEYYTLVKNQLELGD